MSKQSNLQIFNFNEQPVRVVMRDGSPWWVARDVCDVLDHSDASMALRRLDDDEKGTSIVCTPGGKQEMSIVSEPGLYSLILTSRKPEAKAFKRWVTHEILPQIRRAGSYLSPLTLDRIRDLQTQKESDVQGRARLALAGFKSGLISKELAESIFVPIAMSWAVPEQPASKQFSLLTLIDRHPEGEIEEEAAQ